MTVKLEVETFLANYYKTLYGSPVKFPIPLRDPLGFSIVSYTVKQPTDKKPNTGNLEITIPEWAKKDPVTYNYLSENSQDILHQDMILLFYAAIHRFVNDQKRIMNKKNAIYKFMEDYNITEDDLAYLTLVRRYDRYLEQKSTKIRKRFRNVAGVKSQMCPVPVS